MLNQSYFHTMKFNLGDYDLGDLGLGDFSLGDLGLGDFNLGDFNLGDFDLIPPQRCRRKVHTMERNPKRWTQRKVENSSKQKNGIGLRKWRRGDRRRRR